MGLQGYDVLNTWETEGVLYVEVEPRRVALQCKKCGCRRVHERREWRWQVVPLGITRVWIVIIFRRKLWIESSTDYQTRGHRCGVAFVRRAVR